MTEAKTAQTQADAASDEKVPNPAPNKPDSVETTVWVPAGPVAKSEILRTAINSVRDAIPVVYELQADITDSRAAQRDKQHGREYTVTVTYTARGDVGKQEPVDIEKVVTGLEAPRFPGFHEGDPDFGSNPEHA